MSRRRKATKQSMPVGEEDRSLISAVGSMLFSCELLVTLSPNPFVE
jgi:hypothetical protein